jgi:hypothetical protein
MVLIRNNKQLTITNRKTALLSVRDETVRPYMNIFVGIMDKEATP